MQLTILGGSAAGVGTGQGCSGYLVQTESTSTVLDLGPNTLLELRKHVDFRRLDGIVISHLHLDHVLDLFALRFALAYNPHSAPGPVPLHLPPGGLDFMRKAAELFATDPDEVDTYFDTAYAMREYDPERPLEIGDLELTFAPTAHIIPCWAIRVHAPGASGDLVYTADTGVDGDLAGITKGASVVIAESAAKPGTDADRIRALHLTPEQAADIAAGAGANHLVLTHIWEEFGPESFVAAARQRFDGRISIATPGVTISW